tara:strand:+ start:2843 stop:3145 length:303 start_codon:yes stop_codon:yes gene_type:complete
MPFEPKPYIKVGKPKNTFIPRPPKHATHAVMKCHDELSHDGKLKTATLPIQDFDCFLGVSGDFKYIRMDKKGKVHEKYKGAWYWDGRCVPEIQELIDSKR